MVAVVNSVRFCWLCMFRKSCLADFLLVGNVLSQMAELMCGTKGWITIRLVY